MLKKIVSLMIVMMVLLSGVGQASFAQDRGKVVFINMDRTSLLNMRKIASLKEEMSKRGYIANMNVRGDGGTDDRRSYASMGAGSRADVVSNDEGLVDFKKASKDEAEKYKSVVGKSPKGINFLDINKSIELNKDKGEYGSTLGLLGQTLSDNGLKTALLGNSDTVENGSLVPNRQLGLLAMDQNGRINMGNVDTINKKDLTMPYGISTDYYKLENETKEIYQKSDAMFIDLGDTYRLDMYKDSLSDNTYKQMRKTIYNRISKYLDQVFKMVDKNDTVYVSSGFPSELDYKNQRRLAPIIKFKGDGKGLITTHTTRQNGVATNLDVGVDILNDFGLKNILMVGKQFELKNYNDNASYLFKIYDKIVAISNIRGSIINIFVAVISISWIIATVAILFRKHFKHEKIIFKVLRELIKLGILMPLSFMLAALVNFRTPTEILVSIVVITIVLYLLGKFIFKDDLKHMGFFSAVTIVVIVVDALLGTYMMKNNIMSYDAIVGARYYGVGNEYLGVILGSSIFAFSVLLYYFKRFPKWIISLLCLLILISTAYPSMGANVGGAISEVMAYLLFIFLIYEIKIDIKKIILICIAGVAIVFIFAFLDIKTGAQSHLSGFVQQIAIKGPGQIIETFTRKIEMNIKIAQTSVYVNILLVGIIIVAVLMFKPSRFFKKLKERYPIVFRCLIASVFGCVVALLVNDSGIVAAATASIYIFIPIVIISINNLIFSEKSIGRK